MQGRVYALTIEDAQATDTVVVGILPLFSAHAKVLFDPDSTHSFVSCAFAKNHDKSPKLLDFELSVIETDNSFPLIHLFIRDKKRENILKSIPECMVISI